jgi:hypothetical protein
MNNIQSPAPDTDESIEALLQRKGLVAARVTPADIEDAISETVYFTAGQGQHGADMTALRAQFTDKMLSIPSMDDAGPLTYAAGPLSLLTFCVLVLKNGFTVTGESACASPENFDAEVGRRVARENAKQKIWPLLGFALKQNLYDTAMFLSITEPVTS